MSNKSSSFLSAAQAVSHAAGVCIGQVVKAIAWLLTQVGTGISIVTSWIWKRYSWNIVKYVLVMICLYILSQFAGFIAGYSKSAVMSQCGPPGKPPDGNCISTTQLGLEYLSSQTPNQNVLEPLHYAALVNLFDLWRQYHLFIAVICAIAVFVLLVRHQTELGFEQGLVSKKAVFVWLAYASCLYVKREFIPLVFKNWAKVLIGTYTVLLLINPLLCLSAVTKAEASVSSTIGAHALQNAKAAEVQWTDTLYAQSHMGSVYKAQTTAAGRTGIVDLARAHRLGQLTAAQGKAYAVHYPFNDKGTDLSWSETAAAETHLASLRTTVTTLTVVNRLSGAFITWLLLAVPFIAMKSRKFLLKISSYAVVLWIGSQALLTGLVWLDTGLSETEGVTSFAAASFMTAWMLGLPAVSTLLVGIFRLGWSRSKSAATQTVSSRINQRAAQKSVQVFTPSRSVA